MKTTHFATFARLLFSIVWLAAAGAAGAVESLVVTTLADEDNGTSDPGFGTGTSLREAIQWANVDGVNSPITFSATVFAAPRKTITLNGTPLPVIDPNGTVTITAPAAGVEISGNGASRVFQVGNGGIATLRGLTIRNGNAGSGGGIINLGTLLVDACTLTANTAASGGAIYSDTDLAGVTLTLRNCTLSGNSATTAGGALYNADGLTKIESCTIAGNTAPAAAGSGVASLGAATTRTEVLNSIISANGGAGDTDVDYVAGGVNSFLSQEYNLIGDGNATAAFTAFADVTGNTNPGLGALADNGGPTQTRALLAGSPAINTGGQFLLENDQRGVSRGQFAPDDKGAFELEAAIPLFEALTVNTTADEDNKTSDPRFGRGTSLREAIAYANRDGVSSTIVFDPTVFAAPRKTITLAGVPLPTLLADGTLSIPAPPAGVEISGDNASRVFEVGIFFYSRASVTMTGLTIRNGNASGSYGGGILCNSTLTLDACTVRDNVSAFGGGMAVTGEGIATIRNCTFSGNTATERGGGIQNVSHLLILSSTITGNTAPNDDYRGGGVASNNNGSGTLTEVQNSIIAGNTNTDVSFYDLNAFGVIRSLGHNLIGSGNHALAAFNATGDVTGILHADLAPLAENGGPTATHALLATSLAINTGQTDLTVDQRGVTRPQPVGGADDKGAVESTAVADPALVVTTTADVVNASDGVTSLREAVARANSDGVASPITFSEAVFAAPRKRITLAGSQLLLAANARLTITAPAAGVEISGGNASRVFETASGADVTLTRLTIRDGTASGNFGGGILNVGTLEMDSCTLTANSAGFGGAIASDTDLSGRKLNLRNCTLSGNTATGVGGGLYNTDGFVLIDACTIAGNTAPAAGGSGVASRATASTRTEVRNSIISGNGGAAGTDTDFVSGAVNSFASHGWNLIGDGNATPIFIQPNDVAGNGDPGLNARAENGGPTPTRLPLVTSPAVQTGATLLHYDQRGVPRAQRVRDDKGAVELDASAFIDSLVVTTPADEDDEISDPRFGTGTSLREALNFANADGVNSAITFDPTVFAAPRQRIVLTGALPALLNDGTLSITASQGGVEVSGNDQFRVFQVGDSPGASANVTMTGLTIRDGVAFGPSFDEWGGGILNHGTLLLDGCMLTGNSARVGGAIGAFIGTTTLRNSTLSGNTADNGGAIYTAQVTIESSTITGNSAVVVGAGVRATNAQINNSIIAGNNGNDVDTNNLPGIQSGGFNLIGDGGATAAFNATGDQVIGNAAPGVGPLQENGGPTPTMALSLTSPALNAGQTSFTLDQRGVSRPLGGADDIGAFELILLNIAPAGLAPGAVGQAYSASLAVTGGTPPYSVSVIAGSLPPGLTLSGGGVLSGTPLSGGTYSFIVRATGPLAAIGERSYNLTIGTISAPFAGDTVAWYRAEGNAQSFSGPAGTIGGTVGYAPGVVGQAFSFSGGAGYVALDPGLFPAPTTGNTSTAPFSFETWFSTTGSGVILGQQGSSIAPYGAALGTIPAIYVGADGKLRVEMFWTGAINQVTSAGAVNDGQFHHLAAVFDGTNLIAYLDGTAIGTRPITQVGYSTGYFYQLGTGYSPGNRPSLATGWMNFTGLLDETAIYHRALTAAEVQAFWGAGSKGKSTIPAFTAISRSGNDFSFTLKHWPNLRFQIEFSTTLLPVEYQDIGVSFTGDVDGSTDAVRTLPSVSPTGFIRAYEVP